MPHEAIGEIIAAVAEVGFDAAGSASDRKSGLGCLFITIVLLILIGGLYYIATEESTPPTKGLVTKKLPNNKIIIRTQEGEDVYNITPDLYLNKKEGDSIILN